MSNNAINDTVMKAHQNRDMTYDEMNDYEMFNEAAHPARGNLLSIYGIINDINVQMLNERKLAFKYYSSSWSFIAFSHCWRDAIWPIRPDLRRRMVLYTLRLVR